MVLRVGHDHRSSIDVLAERFRDFGATAASRAPLYGRLSLAVADDPEVLALLQVAEDEQAIPVLLFAAVHHALLAEPDAPLANHYPNLVAAPSTADPWPTFRHFALMHADEIRDTVSTRHTQTNEIGRCSLFLPALGLVEHEIGPLSLIDVGTSAGLNLLIDRYQYDYGPSGSVWPDRPGGTDGSVVLACAVSGTVPVPTAMPVVAAAMGIDPKPIDVHDATEVRWLEACVWPDQLDRFQRLVAAVAIAREHGVDVRRGDAVDDLAAAVSEATQHGHPMVMNSWVLNYLTPARREEYVAELDAIGSHTDLSWVLAESPSQTSGLPIPTTAVPEDLTVLSLVRWRDGTRIIQRLATCHPHGYTMRWDPWPEDLTRRAIDEGDRPPG